MQDPIKNRIRSLLLTVSIVLLAVFLFSCASYTTKATIIDPAKVSLYRQMGDSSLVPCIVSDKDSIQSVFYRMTKDSVVASRFGGDLQLACPTSTSGNKVYMKNGILPIDEKPYGHNIEGDIVKAFYQTHPVTRPLTLSYEYQTGSAMEYTPDSMYIDSIRTIYYVTPLLSIPWNNIKEIVVEKKYTKGWLILTGGILYTVLGCKLLSGNLLPKWFGAGTVAVGLSLDYGGIVQLVQKNESVRIYP
jgi:hypothetical protein